MTTQKQIDANRENAKHSTGPTSAEGKLKVSSNRITHGILSSKLLLDVENPNDYQALLNDLQAQLKPVGTLEFSLVEKIAVILWKQRRLISAETAIIHLASHPSRIADEAASGMGLSGYGDDKITPDDLQPLDEEQSEQLAWCKNVISEYKATDSLSLNNLSKKAPLIYTQLAEDAKVDGESIAEHLANTSLEAYIRELIRWCVEERTTLQKKSDRYPALVALSEKAKDKLNIPWQKLDVLTKYQTTLDNQLYKAMKAFREAQEWRMETVETIAPVLESVHADVA